MSIKGAVRRKAAAAAAAAAALVLTAVLGSTYAWNNYRQHKTGNANAGAVLYKARLVERYDPTKADDWKISDPPLIKQVQVKNPGGETPEDKNVYGDVFVRIQLKEFMELYPVTQEYSPYRYLLDKEGDFVSFDPRERYAVAADAEGDPAVTPGQGVLSGKEAAQEYAAILERKYGGGPHVIEQVRMHSTPTHIDEDPEHGLEDGVKDAVLPYYIRTGPDDPSGVYGDFIVVKQTVDRLNTRSLVQGAVNAKADQAGRHQDDINTAGDVGSTQTGNGECLYTPHQWQEGMHKWQPSPTDIPGESFFDYVRWVYGGEVVLASEWDGAPCKKWIVDDSRTNTQGWVYWGAALSPGESTANFLERITLAVQPDDAFYYAVHVDMQAVSYNELGRWAEESDSSGSGKIVAALRRAGMKVVSVQLSPGPAQVSPGDAIQLHASVVGTADVSQQVDWSLAGSEGGSSISESGLLTVGPNETAAELTVTAASRADPEKSASVTFKAAQRPPAESVDDGASSEPVAPRGGAPPPGGANGA